MTKKPFEWTEARLEKLRQLSSEGKSASECADVFEVSVSAIQNARTRYAIRVQKKTNTPANTGITSALRLPPAPFAVEIPRIAQPTKKGAPIRAVVYGDTHFPFQDDKVLNIIKYVIKDTQPDIIVHIGDLIDCWQISRWDKDPARLDTLQDNIDQARTHLHEVSQIAPKARKVLLEGNHEARLKAAIWKMEGAQREFARLRIFQQMMTWPSLLQLDSIGWEFIPTSEQSKTPVLPKLITKHGDKVSKWSAQSAKAEWEKYGASGVSGHTHRLGHFMHRDHNGTATWLEMGCTCDIEPTYGSDFDWQQGFGVFTWSADAFLMHNDIISVRDGQALWGLQTIDGTPKTTVKYRKK